MFGRKKGLERNGVECEAVVLRSSKTATFHGQVDGPGQVSRVWHIEFEVRPPGRAPFTVAQRVDFPVSSRPPAAGAHLPAYVDPQKDEAWIDVTSPKALQTLMNARLAASGLHVEVPTDVSDPAEMTRILSEQIRRQQAQQHDGPT